MIVLDTESTGTQPNQICQFACVEEVDGKLRGLNYFFAVDVMNTHAQDKHGYSIEALKRLSGGRRFADHAPEIFGLLHSKCLVGHSVASDALVLKHEFKWCDIEYNPSKQFCTMKHFTQIMNIPQHGQRRPKAPNLAELCTYLGVTSAMISDLHYYLFGLDGNWHDAQFDACATYLCVRRGEDLGLIRGLNPKGR